MDTPLATREVREFLRSTMLCHGCLTQRSRCTPCGRIIDVDIGYEAFFQTIHKTIIHDVVHSAVATRFASHLSSCFPKRVLVLFTKPIDRLPVLLLRAVDENTRRVIGESTLRARDRVEAAVRSWVDYIMLEKNGTALLRFDDAGVHVATDV